VRHTKAWCSTSSTRRRSLGEGTGGCFVASWRAVELASPIWHHSQKLASMGYWQSRPGFGLHHVLVAEVSGPAVTLNT
jgi:hypothetical protein